jgi:hypothetical protein
MLKKINNGDKLSNKNIKLIKKEEKKYLFSSPYQTVIKVLNSLKYFLSSNNNNSKAVEELEWVINIICNNLLYFNRKTLYHNKNKQILLGNHKIKDFSNEVDSLNKEYEDLIKKYFQIELKNEEFAKYLSYTEKNISIVNNSSQHNYESKSNSGKKNKSVGIIKKFQNSNKKILSQIPTQLMNDYNQIISSNSSIADIYYTDKNGFSKKENLIFNNFYRNKRLKEFSFDSQDNVKYQTNKNLLYNNYRICSTMSLNGNNEKISNIFDSNDNFISKTDSNNNNVRKVDKIVSLPIIQFKYKGGTKIDKYKINIFNKKNNIYQKTEIENEKRNMTSGQEYRKNKISINMNILKNIDVDKIFDYTNFDIFKLKDKIGLENVMPFLGKEIIKKLNINHLIEESKLDNFLMILSKSYQNTRALYHTSLHGVDVCYSTYLILTFLKDNDNKIKNISDFDIVSLVFSALSHDVGHPGLTNKFLINSKDEISIIYNDISVLENFHSAKTFQLLENNDLNIFSNLSKEDFSSLRKKIIEEILATDMSYHSKIVNEFKEYKKNYDIKMIQNQLSFITHISDLSHNYRRFEVSLKWVDLLSNEFWNQGDKEKELGLPVSYLCDRNDIDVPKSQVSFINTFSLPTIELLVEINTNFNYLKNNAIDNLNKWKKLESENRKRGWTPEKNEKSN